MQNQQNPMLCADWEKLTNFGQKRAKKGRKYFCQKFDWVILVIDHKCSFNMQNQQNPISVLEEIGQNVNFWVKMDKFWQKRAKKIFVKTVTG